MCQPFHIHFTYIVKFHLMYNYISMHQKESFHAIFCASMQLSAFVLKVNKYIRYWNIYLIFLNMFHLALLICTWWHLDLWQPYFESIHVEARLGVLSDLETIRGLLGLDQEVLHLLVVDLQHAKGDLQPHIAKLIKCCSNSLIIYIGKVKLLP